MGYDIVFCVSADTKIYKRIIIGNAINFNITRRKTHAIKNRYRCLLELKSDVLNFRANNLIFAFNKYELRIVKPNRNHTLLNKLDTVMLY